jgi:DNA-binding NarL/FixJ family response regulator
MDACLGRREDRRVSDRAELLRQARAAHHEHRFAGADGAFSRADRLGELSTDDLVAWQDSTWWLGQADRALELAEAAHQRLVAEGQTTLAAQAAIGLGFLLMLRGDLAAGSGWMQRGRSLLERSPDETARWYVVHLDAESALHGGDLDRAVDLARQVRDAARRAPDPTLLSLALMTEGTARLRGGAVAEGMAMLDEAMLPVQAGRIPPDMAGNLYCQMIAVCWELYDLRRAREWTAATERWCEHFDSAVMFSGICRMHRVQLRQVSGEWDVAADDARVVCTELVGMNVQVVAEGHYLLGELLRLRGDVVEAEAAYLRAHELGRDPQPGLALLTAQTDAVAAGLASLRTALATHRGPDCSRAPLLHAVVDLAVEVPDLDAAVEASEQLTAMAHRWQSEGLYAVAAHARGAVRIAAGDPGEAVTGLREAVRRWQELEAPHACARSRMLLAQAYSALGDHGAATRELDVAERTLTRLDAVVDLRRLERLRRGAGRPRGLTPREAEILREVTRGGTNRQVADALVISEKTVARHLANIYTKLGVSTRTAAVAWARDAGL